MQAGMIRMVAVCLLLIPMALLNGCDKNRDADSQMVIIEEGQEEQSTDNVKPDHDQFTDNGRETTVDDLLTARSKIESYYYEQTIAYASGSANIKTWYMGGKVKIISSVGDAGEDISYYDCADHTVVSYSPDNDYHAVQTSFDDQDLDILIDEEDYDYRDWEASGFDTIEDQCCMILENSNGNKYWVSTKYGIPLQVEFTDSFTGERLKVGYQNFRINSLDQSEVEIPDDLQV